MSDYFIGHIRTYVPIVVAWIVTTLALRFEIVIAEDTSAQLVAGITGLLAAIYYGTVRLFAQKWPGFGALLGVNQAPHYREE